MRKKIKILIADESKIFRETLKLFLVGKQKYEVIGECINCFAVQSFLANKLPDIVILCYEMLFRPGEDFIKKIKAEYGNKIRFIALIRYTEKEYKEMMIRVGADGCIKEDDIYYQLENAIQKVLNGELFYKD